MFWTTEAEVGTHGYTCPQGPNTGLQTQHLSVVSLKVDSKSMNPRGHLISEPTVIFRMFTGSNKQQTTLIFVLSSSNRC